MHRSADDAVIAFQDYVRRLARSGARNAIVLLVYQPQHEPQLLVRLPEAARDLAREGIGVDVVDLGPWFIRILESEGERLRALRELEAESEDYLISDLGQIVGEGLYELFTSPLPEGATARLIVNTGVLASLVSYSAITNDLAGSTAHSTPPTVVAFPGEGDERAVNLLGLRLEPNYRIPRI